MHFCERTLSTNSGDVMLTKRDVSHRNPPDPSPALVRPRQRRRQRGLLHAGQKMQYVLSAFSQCAESGSYWSYFGDAKPPPSQPSCDHSDDAVFTVAAVLGQQPQRLRYLACLGSQKTQRSGAMVTEHHRNDWTPGNVRTYARVQRYFGQTPRYRNLHQTQNGMLLRCLITPCE
ncbi:hypothetical protein HPB48_013231 [Haemaphysalis longicornis]|uniref:Uncharacterized protein n=1 Tax=Haemaphysalis longicornis TaxID=44386 RepID=A0A9J6GRH0_HAELO|nr:hypothetical protein HPB48_013231 [Haemaphysalis longicornis]